MVEHLLPKQRVAGSSPVSRSEIVDPGISPGSYFLAVVGVGEICWGEVGTGCLVRE